MSAGERFSDTISYVCEPFGVYVKGAEIRIKATLKAAFILSKLAPEVGLEPTTLRLRFVLCFHIGADYLINFARKLPGAYGVLLVWLLNP